MAFDLASLLQNPVFQFGINTLGGASKKWHPIAQALQMYQNQSRLTQEQENRDEYLRVQKEAAEARRAEEAAAKQAAQAQAAAVRASIAGELQPPPGIPPTVNVGGERPFAFKQKEPVLPGGGWDMPSAYESDKMRVFKAIDNLAQVDPKGAMSMAKDVYSGDIPVQGMPGKPKRAPTLRDFMLPGGEQQTQQWDEAAGAWSPVGQPVPRWKPDRPRAAGGGSAGGDGTPPKKLTAEMGRTRSEIQAARKAVERIAATGIDPRVFAEQNPGFKATLEKANKRMPGGDNVWEDYMTRSAAKLREEEAARKARAAYLRKQMGM